MNHAGCCTHGTTYCAELPPVWCRTRELEFVKEFKQAHRKDDDIALVNAGMRVLLTPPPSSSPSAAPTVAEVALAFGGVAAKSVRAPKTEAFLLSKPWTEDTLTAALQILQEDIVVPDAAPGGMPQFRRSLTASFLFKFFLHAAYALPSPSAFGSLPESYRSAVEVPEKPLPRGIQVYEVSETGEAVGAPVVHQSADVQVTGEAQYADDVPLPADGLHGALVLSTRPHAKILGIDTSAAEAMPGYAGFFGAKDVPGSNVAGAVVHDEEFFASEKVSCVGHVRLCFPLYCPSSVSFFLCDKEGLLRRICESMASMLSARVATVQLSCIT